MKLENGRDSYDVPSSVHMEEGVADTPRTGNIKGVKSMGDGVDAHRRSKSGEVDAYENPTELFQWINYGNYQSAAAHALEHPLEVKTWIVSRKPAKNGEQTIKWRYLPLHLACMKSNPSEDLLHALISSYPIASRERDYAGNLPIHYLLLEGCENKNIIEMLLKANPASIDKRDRKGRSLIEIVSEDFRSGKLRKDAMVNILATLRQWSISEDRSLSGNLLNEQQIRHRSENEESREAPPSDPPSKSAFTFDEAEDDRRSKRGPTSRSESKSTGRRRHDAEAIFRPAPSDVRNGDDEFDVNPNNKGDKRLSQDDGNKLSPDVLEARLENALTDIDLLRKTVRKLKAENKNQEMAVIALNQLVDNAAVEQQKNKERMKKKKEFIEGLQQQLKEQGDRFENHERIFYDKEKKLKGKDKQLRELSDRIVKLVEENSKLRENFGGESLQLSSRLHELEEENQKLRDRASKNHASKVRVKELEEKLEFYQGEHRDVHPLKTGMATENRLLARIKALERERYDSSSEDLGENLIRSSEISLIENERIALKEMNASLQEHVGALKERCKHLEDAGAERNELQQHVQRLEGDLIHARLKQSEYHDEMEQVRSEASIIESRLQTKLAKLEMELLEIRGTQDTAGSVSTNVDEEKKLEERRALQAMNTSLKEHIAALMAKCSTLEKSLTEVREKNTKLADEIRNARFDSPGGRNNPELELTELRERNAILIEELKAARYDDIGERQKELHSEFHNLFNLVKEMANGGAGAESTKNNVASSLENETLRKDNAALKVLCAETQLEIEKLLTELKNLREIQASIESRPENSCLEPDRVEPGQAGRRMVDDGAYIRDIKVLESRLLEVTQRADFSEREVKELKERLELAKSTIVNLREIISKNNDTYIAKVESLADELHNLRQTNESLHSHIHELSVENRGLRRGDLVRDFGHEDQQGQLESLRTRLNHVAGYLIALSLVLDEENGGGGSSLTDDVRSKVRNEVMRRQQDLLASDGRDDIVQIANYVGQELRSGHPHPQVSLLSGQRDELNAISADLQNFR